MRAEVSAASVTTLPARLNEWVDRAAATTSRKAASAIVLARLKHRAAALAHALDAAGTLYAAEPLHQLRIAAKKLRYVLELARPAAGLAAAREARVAKDAQSRLGEIHDLQMLQARVQAAASESTLDHATARQLADLDRALETRCREQHATFLSSVPRLRHLAERLPAEMALRLVHRRRVRMARMTAAPIAARGDG